MEEDEPVPAIGALPFCQLVRAIATQIDPSLKWTYEAVQTLHEGAEDALARLARRTVVPVVTPEDMRVVREVLVPRRVIHPDPLEDGIGVSGFKKEIRQLRYEIGLEDFEWEEDALEILRQAAEDHAVEIFEKSKAMARQAGKSTVGLNEYRFCRFILGRRKFDW
ncbi:hypothetical protein LXA43DRAFT_906511 [Ganoderma leucocontextum]|nr:hypothetical protein LXA43DRAFT_906511 [Ganoderma leucocontextum]